MNEYMHILLINVPSRKGAGGKFLPLGLLYVGEILERAGHSVQICDPYIYDPEMIQFDSGDFSRIDSIVQDHKPDIIGFGGIGSSYPRAKRLSKHLSAFYPEILQIAGGPLSSIYQHILHDTGIQIVFHGEADLSLPAFIEKYQNRAPLWEVPGISFMVDGHIQRNAPADQIHNLDTIPFPAYHLINPDDYCDDISQLLAYYQANLPPNAYTMITKKLRTKKSAFPILTSRGCTNRCTFCYRHMKGYRQHSVSYVIEHIKMLQNRYQIHFFEICDEMFNSRREWIVEFCHRIEMEKLDIVYRILGARVDRIDRELLEMLKRSGCIEINYGQESGSDTILKELRKGTSVQQNREITRLSKELGLICPVQLVIGSPSETSDTIRETIQFLVDVDCRTPSVNYLLPFPETPIWEYVEQLNLIPDLESYLDTVATYGGAPLVNLTSVPERAWKSWNFIIKNEIRLATYRKDRRYFMYVILYLPVKTASHVFPYIPRYFITAIKKILGK